MIKQINISNMDKLKEQMERALSDGYTHIIPILMKFKFISP